MAKTLQEKIAVMQAAAEGKKIEFRDLVYVAWADCPNPKWNWGYFDYRVKPEPREFWINLYPCNMYPYDSKESADLCASTARLECIHVREVIEE